MARLIQRHWKAAMIQALLLVLAFVVWIGWSLRPDRGSGQALAVEAQPAAPSSPAVDALTYSRIRELRERLSLSNQDLAAMGCTEGQATQVLSTLLTWYRQNAGAWDQAESAEVAARRNLQEAMRQINIGPRDEALISRMPGLKAALASSTAARRQLESSAGAAVSSLFSSAQNTVWSTAKSNASFPDRYRYAAGLSADQAAQLERAMYTNTLEVVEPGVVSGGARSSQAAAWLAINTNLDGVSKAEDAVLHKTAD